MSDTKVSEPPVAVHQTSSILKAKPSAGAVAGSVHSRPSFLSNSQTANPSSELLVLDSMYIKKHLGFPLTLALAEIATKRPTDPIHYLGHWLLKWRWNQEQKQLQEDKVHALIEDKKKIAERIREEARQVLERKRIAAETLREEAEGIVGTQIDYLLATMELKELPEPIPAEVQDPEEEPTEDIANQELPTDETFIENQPPEDNLADEPLADEALTEATPEGE